MLSQWIKLKLSIRQFVYRIYVNNLVSSWDHLSYGITQYTSVPATRQKWFSRLYPRRIAGTHLSTPEGWKTELTWALRVNSSLITWITTALIVVLFAFSWIRCTSGTRQCENVLAIRGCAQVAFMFVPRILQVRSIDILVNQRRYKVTKGNSSRRAGDYQTFLNWISVDNYKRYSKNRATLLQSGIIFHGQFCLSVYTRDVCQNGWTDRVVFDMAPLAPPGAGLRLWRPWCTQKMRPLKSPGERCELPSGVWGGAPAAEIEFRVL